ncbi:hypothetical protein BLOT_006801 [Blomia tropicalis]|nr:hypothetical protein BLOT_006801 [Blomia tropicalis]
MDAGLAEWKFVYKYGFSTNDNNATKAECLPKIAYQEHMLVVMTNDNVEILTFSNEITCFRNCSIVYGASGWRYNLAGDGGSALPATSHDDR